MVMLVVFNRRSKYAWRAIRPSCENVWKLETVNRYHVCREDGNRLRLPLYPRCRTAQYIYLWVRQIRGTLERPCSSFRHRPPSRRCLLDTVGRRWAPAEGRVELVVWRLYHTGRCTLPTRPSGPPARSPPLHRHNHNTVNYTANMCSRIDVQTHASRACLPRTAWTTSISTLVLIAHAVFLL